MKESTSMRYSKKEMRWMSTLKIRLDKVCNFHFLKLNLCWSSILSRWWRRQRCLSTSIALGPMFHFRIWTRTKSILNHGRNASTISRTKHSLEELKSLQHIQRKEWKKEEDLETTIGPVIHLGVIAPHLEDEEAPHEDQLIFKTR